MRGVEQHPWVGSSGGFGRGGGAQNSTGGQRGHGRVRALLGGNGRCRVEHDECCVRGRWQHEQQQQQKQQHQAPGSGNGSPGPVSAPARTRNRGSHARSPGRGGNGRGDAAGVDCMATTDCMCSDGSHHTLSPTAHGACRACVAGRRQGPRHGWSSAADQSIQYNTPAHGLTRSLAPLAPSPSGLPLAPPDGLLSPWVARCSC